jgi:hypothetical protein
MGPGLRQDATECVVGSLAVIASEAKQSISWRLRNDGLLRRFAPRNDGVRHLRKSAFSRHESPELCISFRPLLKRAQGKPGARCTRGLVCNGRNRNAHEHTGSAEALRLSLRDGLRLIRALPGETRLCCHRPRKDACAHFTRGHRPLGRQNHTISPSASCALVSCAIGVHRISPQRP